MLEASANIIRYRTCCKHFAGSWSKFRYCGKQIIDPARFQACSFCGNYLKIGCLCENEFFGCDWQHIRIFSANRRHFPNSCLKREDLLFLTHTRIGLYSRCPMSICCCRQLGYRKCVSVEHHRRDRYRWVRWIKFVHSFQNWFQTGLSWAARILLGFSLRLIMHQADNCRMCSQFTQPW